MSMKKGSSAAKVVKLRNVGAAPPSAGPGNVGAAAPSAARRGAAPESSRSAKAPSPASILGPGAHFARLTRKIGDARYEAQLPVGDRIEISVAPEVDLALADRCLSDQSTVLVGGLGEEVVMFGALRTRESTQEEVVIEAPRRLVLRAGKSKLVLTAEGKIKLSGDDVTVDAPREVRLASAKVEIP